MGEACVFDRHVNSINFFLAYFCCFLARFQLICICLQTDRSRFFSAVDYFSANMWKLQISYKSLKEKYRQYSPTKLTTAYQAVQETGLAVRKAAKLYGVPLTTLRDRVDQRVHVDTVKSGPDPLLSELEEARLVEHIGYMAELGYGYSRAQVIALASDLAIHVGKRERNKPLSRFWFSNFQKRWPKIKLMKPRSLTSIRAKAASMDTVQAYYTELETILDRYHLKDRPEGIYNVDEKGISTEHTPPYIVCTEEGAPQAVTSPRGKNTTIIGCGNAIGQQLPPYFVFAGKRKMDHLIEGGLPGTDYDNQDAYSLALSPGNLRAAFRKAGIYPFNRSAVPESKLKPSTVFKKQTQEIIQSTDLSLSSIQTSTNLVEPTDNDNTPKTSTNSSMSNQCLVSDPSNCQNEIDNSVTVTEFFDGKNIQAETKKKKRKPIKSISGIVGGHAITEDNVTDQIKKFKKNQSDDKKKKPVKSTKQTPDKMPAVALSPQPGPSAYYVDDSGNDFQSEDSDTEGDCCICHKNSPPGLRDCLDLVIVKWALCDICGHWTHLRFCSSVRVVRRHSEFRCPHCDCLFTTK
ncbi:LOW QUALITY PROTEIN: hypothetical protein KUTeg_014162 [Tegillarca granosa]|uniref:HTH psq-type domain-containing protein n=1 Tax=Tegillarca granosa TaxID=220873 RepID=A0ABQ9EVU9_TEGGR|nr:LOW QUALITY PROTEIN: hypothetical protein KUTeg_014162 [Tegillarca granosa]